MQAGDGGTGDVEAIHQLKYAYFRLLDLKRFDELGELLTEGCTASYEDGTRRLSGRPAIVEFLDQSLRDPRIVSSHFGHHPEIRVLSPDSAAGTWYLQDRVVALDYDLEIGGTALYADEYARIDGRWLISHTGYERIFEERRVHSTMEVRSFRSRF
ncbi:MAG: nuclear transport factor 2 family protein [Acidimicrobiales bacterium]